MQSRLSLMELALLVTASPLVAASVTVSPEQSLQEAADKLQPGDTLVLAEGTYHQSFVLTRSGTAGSPITIKAAVPGKVIITGAMEATPKFEQLEGPIYKTKWSAKGLKDRGTRKVWVVADGRSLYNYTSMEEMKTCKPGKGRDTTPLEGFLCRGDELYIRLLGGANPNQANVAISRPDTTVLLEIKGQQHIVIEGLRLRVAPTHAILISSRNDVSRHVVIRDCCFLGAYEAIASRGMRKNDREFGPSDVTVEYCEFSNYPTYDWLHYSMILEQPAWGALYHSTLGGNAILPGGNVTAWKIRHC